MMRRKARELALQILFQAEVGRCDVEKAVKDALRRADPAATVQEYALRLVRGVDAHREDIDNEIARRSREWSLDRIANVDRNILRIGLFELLFAPDVPASVAANEAVELAKEFSTADSGRFVNGILGSLIRERDGGSEFPAGELPEEAVAGPETVAGQAAGSGMRIAPSPGGED